MTVSRKHIIVVLLSIFVSGIFAYEKLSGVNLQLRWYHQFQFAGYYAAKELGYYKEAGLDVNIIEGGIYTDVMKEVISGTSDYGVQTPSIVVDKARGYPVVVLAAVFQHSPVALIVKSSSGIKMPSDLKGKTIMLGDKNVEIRAMLSRSGIIDSLNIIGFTGDYRDILDKKIDGSAGYITDISYVEGQDSSLFSYIRPKDHGIDFYGDCLFTSKKEISQNPERVKAFREASMRGWKFAMDNPDIVIDIISEKYNTKADKAKLLYEYRHLNKLMFSELVEIGHMNPARWGHIVETFQELKVIPEEFELRGFLYTDYIKDDNKLMRTATYLLIFVFLVVITVLWKNYLKERRKEREEEIRHKIELERSETRFREIIEFAADGILLGSAEGSITDANEAVCRIFRMKREEMIGKSIADMPFTEESINSRPLRFDLLKQGMTVVNERAIKLFGGNEIIVEMKTKMMPDGTYQSIYRDITDRKNIEKELKDNEKKYSQLVLNISDGVGVVDKNEVFQYVNKSAENIFEVEEGSLEKRSLWDFVSSENKEKILSESSKRKSGESTEYELDIITGKGNHKTIYVKASPNYDENGNFLATYGVFYDITERKRYESLLKIFREAVENSQDGIGMASPEGRHYYQNSAMTRLLGEVGEDPLRVFADKEVGANMFDEIKSGKRWAGEVEMYSPSGSVLNILLRAYPVFDSEGKIVTLVGIHTDITNSKTSERKLRESEEKFRMLFEVSNDAIYLMENDTFIECNSMAVEMFACASKNDMIGHKPTEFSPPIQPDGRDSSGLATAHINAAVSGSPQRFYWKHRKKDGSLFDAEVSLNRLVLNEKTYLQAIVRDVTFRMQAENEIKKLNESLEKRIKERTAQLEDANQELESFSYSVSHDLRAPVRHISGFADILDKNLKSGDTVKVHESLRKISESVNNMERRIDDLLEFSRTGRLELHKIPVDMNKIISSLIEVYRSHDMPEPVKWKLQELPVIKADKNLVTIVWENLIDNAYKYTRVKKKPEAEIGFTDNGTDYVFFIKDNGVGFDMEYVHKLFGGFQRLHLEKDFTGTGIGLATVKRIITRHGGNVSAEGKVNEGAVFYFSLPK